jgi:hypothetical protein
MTRWIRYPSLALTVACAPEINGPTPIFSSGGSFFDQPWPADFRARADGAPDLATFPNPSGVALIDTYTRLAEEIPGFANNAPVYFRFDGPLDLDRLPSPEASLTAESPLVLVDVDPASPHRGERFPVQWQWFDAPGAFQAENQLAIVPVFGFPLRPSTTYAAIVTTAVAAPHPDFPGAFDEDHPLHAAYAPLADALFFLGVDARDVAVATVFTTQDPLAEMRTLVRFVRDNIEMPDLSQSVDELRKNNFYQAFQGTYLSPVFQAGVRPYRESEGGFAFDEAGTPQITAWDEMRFSLCGPLDLSNPPANGWAIAIQQHGTGGDFASHCDSNQGMEVAAQLGDVGILSIGIDQPLHGTRGTSDTLTDLDTFNINNPESARTNQRQGAIDAIYLAHALREHPPTFTLPDGQTVRIDPEKILFFGHSQGGTTGALAAPWLGADVQAAVLSGTGGGLAITLVERKDPLDIAQVVAATTGFFPEEVLTPLHPVAALVQHLVEVTDPMNYAPYWYAEDGLWSDHTALSVLLTSGLLDPYTPYASAEALAAAARMPQLVPAATEPVSLALRGLSPVEAPLTGNAPTFDGGAVTAALSQWPDADHFPVFDSRELAVIYREFLRSAAEGEATLTDP